MLFRSGVGLSMRAMVIDGKFAELPDYDSATTAFFGSADIIAPVAAGLALVTLLAAIMSSASSFITIGASAIMRDLASGLNITVKRELLWGRFYSAIVVLCSLLFALYLDQIIYLMGAFGWAAFAAATFGPIILGIYWRRATGIAAFLSMFFGLLFNFILTVMTSKGYITTPDYFFTGGITFVIGVLVFIIVSYMTESKKDQEKFDNLYFAEKNTKEAP